MAMQSEAWTVFARSNTEIVGSNSTGGMEVCACVCVCARLFCVCVLCVGSGNATDWSPVQGLLTTVDRIRKAEKEAKP
jgi:hypothetical protein